MKAVKSIYKNIDKGRLIAVPLFVLLTWINILGFHKGIKILLPINPVKSLGLIHHLLIICFYVLVILLYFLRSSASITTKSFYAKAIAIATSCLPLTFPILNRSISENPVILIIANIVMIFGMFFSIYSLFVLGRNFSIIPQVRGLVQSGPYRIIRHPLYTGEIVSYFGIFLVRPSISTFAVFLLLIFCQVYRALQEEMLLDSIFPEYKSYRSKTARFIPYIF
ncbi:MAG: methyltransferase family protein [bacterium]